MCLLGHCFVQSDNWTDVTEVLTASIIKEVGLMLFSVGQIVPDYTAKHPRRQFFNVARVPKQKYIIN
jgi:hypothetical protein